MVQEIAEEMTDERRSGLGDTPIEFVKMTMRS